MSLITHIQDLVTAIGTDIKQLKTWVTGSSSGDLTTLNTTDKSSLIGAINEVKAGSSGAPPSATTAAQGIIEIATLAEVAAGVDTDRAVTAQGVRQERLAVKDEILGAGIPAALDTLKELADAIGDDANFAATVTTGLANRVRADINTQGLTLTQKQNARTNIDVWGTTDIGDTETDLVSVYTAAKT